MTSRLRCLEFRQQELKTQCNYERRNLGQHINSLERPIAWANKGLNVIHFFTNHPLILTGVFAALSQYKPKLASKVLAVVCVVKLLKSKLN
jgi:hypothetical protein